MVYKNTIKVFFSNFNIVWKMALYFLLIGIVGFFLLYFSLNPIFRLIEEAGFFDLIVEAYSDFLSTLNLSVALECVAEILEGIFDFFVANFSSIWINVICFIIIVFFLNSILFNLSNMATCMSLHFYIGSLTRHGFFASFSENFGKNLKHQLCSYLVNFPLNMLYLYLFIMSLKLFGISWMMNIVAVFIIIIGLVVLLAFKWTIFSTWSPTMVVMNYGVFKSLKVGIKNAFRRFGRVFSNAVGLVVTIIILNMFFGLFTFMVGLVLSVPISFLLYNAFGMVVVYEGQGMRYYVDIYNVVTPTKKEVSDKIKDMKYVI